MSERSWSGWWLRVPSAWVDDPAIDRDKLSVLISILRHVNLKTGVARVSQARLGAHLGMSRAWVNAVVSDLAALGLLERRDGGAGVCLYRIVEARRAAAPASAPSAVSAADEAGQPGDVAVQPAGTNKTPSSVESLPRARDAGLESGAGPLTAAEGDPSRADAVPPPPVKSVVGVDWRPDAGSLAWARARFPDLDLEAHAAHFVSSCRANGYRYLDHDAAWRAWLLDPKGRSGARAPSSGLRGSGLDASLEAGPRPPGSRSADSALRSVNASSALEVRRRREARAGRSGDRS